MNDIYFFQSYWWFLIAVLGAALVFLLFVQGGQSMLFGRCSEEERSMMVNSLGRKWELTFTTLVVFGGAFFASFPLFYSTSFGGAYWLWMAILISFVLQSVSYEYRRKRGNLYGTRTYDVFLFINGFFGCVLLGVAVSMMFTGGDFVVGRSSLLNPLSPVISRWAPTHGLEAMVCWKNLLLGAGVFFLARTLASLYFINNLRGVAALTSRLRRSALVNGLVFAVLFVAWVTVILFSAGLRADADGTVVSEPYLYLHNLTGMWWWGVVFLSGVVLTLAGIGIGSFTDSRRGIWWSGFGVVLVVVALFAIAAYGGTCYLPSLADPQSSLTLANSSSSLYTLRTMSWVSLFIPVVIIYIICVWRKMNAGGLTPDDVAPDRHRY